jgi:Fe-S cluster assembly protein SufD
MELKEKLIASFMAFENEVDLNNPVHEIRSEALRTFETKGFPHRKLEAWKYTSLDRLQKVDFSLFPKDLPQRGQRSGIPGCEEVFPGRNGYL